MAKKKWRNIDRKSKKIPETKKQELTHSMMPKTFYGFDGNDNLKCMVAEVSPEHLVELQKENYPGFAINDWFVSSGECPKVTVKGPFKTVTEAFDYAQSTFQVQKFQADPTALFSLLNSN